MGLIADQQDRVQSSRTQQASRLDRVLEGVAGYRVDQHRRLRHAAGERCATHRFGLGDRSAAAARKDQERCGAVVE
jgi:hypothetical protein